MRDAMNVENEHPKIVAARNGEDPALVCKVISGWVFLCNLQFLSGYCILQADPTVASINDLDAAGRAQFLTDMILVGDALMEVTGAYRVNYAIAGNSDPVLHAHIVPRYMDEPEELRIGLPWSHPTTYDPTTFFDAQRDRELIKKLSDSIKAHST